MAHTNHSPAYISSTDYLIPPTLTKFGERAFCVSGPVIWNSLPESLSSSAGINIFKSRLKTYFFTLAYEL
jgi:hypothetical protein